MKFILSTYLDNNIFIMTWKVTFKFYFPELRAGMQLGEAVLGLGSVSLCFPPLVQSCLVEGIASTCLSSLCPHSLPSRNHTSGSDL